jgi:hypothetical protein
MNKEKEFLEDEKGNIAKHLLVAGFPGTGKSYYCSNGDWSQYVPQGFATDSDSSKFDKSNFPQNYIEHIKEKISEGYARIFISSHKEVRDALVENGLEFTLVYPKKELKEEYLKRYKERGSANAFINLISNNWDLWLDELKNQKGCKHIELESGQFICNVC